MYTTDPAYIVVTEMVTVIMRVAFGANSLVLEGDSVKRSGYPATADRYSDVTRDSIHPCVSSPTRAIASHIRELIALAVIAIVVIVKAF